MKTLQYSFAQIEAFATIAETGSLSQAAIRLAKDRTTLRDLLDYLEDALGYRLFSREGRSLTLTAEGEQLFRQAHLLLRQAQAFESFAQTLPQTAGQALRLVYDPFVPREFLCALADNLARTADPPELLERLASRSRAGAERWRGGDGDMSG